MCRNVRIFLVNTAGAKNSTYVRIQIISNQQ